ncbi:MAG: response regulator [Calditrichaceae bacterium]|nr:response regulator [Calditrichaceae bacterium]MBN2708490.1 response regulator [Calditrichaceae bacterium]RQV91961.1 MAG: hybrid sensor histidine kinase/response regulator [Calditrichota bacterium]
MSESEYRAKVLIVEDNKENLDLIRYFLKSQNYILYASFDGEEALKQVAEIQPDIILLDIMLPKIDGFQVCEELKKNPETRFIPIIMITALKELKDKIRSLEAGADDFISKPFENIELLTRVKSLLRVKKYHDELKHTNNALKEKNDILVWMDQYKEDLTHLIVHDMKNPLFVIQGNLQMMTMGMDTDRSEMLRKYIDRIERSANNLLRMVTNLIDISKIEAGTMKLNLELGDLNSIIERSYKRFTDLPENETKAIRLNLDSKIRPFKFDTSVIERVVDSLISFAYSNVNNDGNIEIETSLNDESVILSIADDGVQLPVEYGSQLFDKFHQVEIKNEGHRVLRGLGLTFCKLAINAHNGNISIDKDYKKGNKFVVLLPVKKLES